MNDSSERFAELKARYVQSLADKHAALARAWHDLATAPGERTAVELQTMAHRLAGSAPAYGYDAIGAAAHDVDALLNAWAKRPPAERESIGTLVEHLAQPMRALIQSLARAIETAPGTD